MNIEHDADTIFPRPVKCFERILPTDLGQERLSFPRVYGPKGDGEAHPIESRTSYLSKVLLGLKYGRQ